jgi:hypothetical protein
MHVVRVQVRIAGAGVAVGESDRQQSGDVDLADPAGAEAGERRSSPQDRGSRPMTTPCGTRINSADTKMARSVPGTACDTG